MNILAHPKKVMWLCRLIPAAIWVTWLVAIITSRPFGPRSEVGALEFLLLASLLPYLLLVYFVLPELLLPAAHRGFTQRAGYFLFTGLTAGLGPWIWYLLSVDPVLRRMADTKA